ncbi:MAG TPA: nicotinamide riboside transporter PnuC [Vicinamibacteria bacterium]|nr:nicotinamide riboside transporter PnuC [Vicinamibacteria bacterium]
MDPGRRQRQAHGSGAGGGGALPAPAGDARELSGSTLGRRLGSADKEAGLSGFSLAEWTGAVLGAVYVWLAIRESPWCWPFGIANVSLFLVVFAHARLYGAAALQALYVALSVYGWYEWLHGGEAHGRLEVARTPSRWAPPLLAAGVAGSIGLGLALKAHTNEALPWSDAAATAFSLVAQLMATRKWLENWLVWIAVDAVYVGMNLSQGLYAATALYAVFLVMAAFGFRAWRTSLRSRAAEAVAG